MEEFKWSGVSSGVKSEEGICEVVKFPLAQLVYRAFEGIQLIINEKRSFLKLSISDARDGESWWMSTKDAEDVLEIVEWVAVLDSGISAFSFSVFDEVHHSVYLEDLQFDLVWELSIGCILESLTCFSLYSRCIWSCLIWSWACVNFFDPTTQNTGSLRKRSWGWE